MSDRPAGQSVNFHFPLEYALLKLDLESIRYSDELTNERRTDESLRSKVFFTADGAAYTVERDEPILYLSRINLIFGNFRDACRQIEENGNYIPKTSEMKKVFRSRETIRAPLSKLTIVKESANSHYFEIPTDIYDECLNAYERELAERVFGQGRDFRDNMQMFREAGVDTALFYVLDPEYVLKNTESDKAIVRLSKLFEMEDLSGFLADDCNVDDEEAFVRGLPFSENAGR
ncbi:hypothetical protein KY308_00760 [Candidatus Woesearchaeota archaeon]|nr:hypothetical protein [Candidatus Woesearchaeota archaeon]